MPRERPILVTGGSGFIGRHLLARLAREGAPLVLLARASEERETRQAALDALLDPSLVEVRVIDWDAPAEVAAAVSESPPSIVYHLAGQRVMGLSRDGLAESVRANLQPVVALLGALIEHPPRAFVFAGTAEVYGDQPAPFHERVELKPATPYAATKAAAESLGLMAARATGFPFVAARMGVIYGPGQPPVMFVPQLIEAGIRGEAFAMSPGEQVRDLVFVEDAVEALVALARTPAAHGQAVNIGSGQGVRLRDLAERIHAMMGQPMPLEIGGRGYREGEIMEYSLSVDRILKLTGWKPAVALEQGLARTIEWARSARRTPAKSGA